MAHMFCTVKQAAERLETTEAEIEGLLNEGILREFRDGRNRLVKSSDLEALEAELCPAGTGAAQTARSHNSTTCRKRPGRTSRKTSASSSSRKVMDREQEIDDSDIICPRPSIVDPASHGSSAAEKITLPPTASVTAVIRPSTPEPPNRSSSRHPQAARQTSTRPASGVRANGRPAGSAVSPKRPKQASRGASSPAVQRRSSAPAAPARAFTAQRSRSQTQELSLGEWIWLGLLDDRPHTILALLGALLLAACTVTGAVYLLMRTL